jgi:hypothetical protein
MIYREKIRSLSIAGIEIGRIHIVILSMDGSVINSIGVHRITRPSIPIKIEKVPRSKFGFSKEVIEFQGIDCPAGGRIGHFGSVMVGPVSVVAQTL